MKWKNEDVSRVFVLPRNIMEYIGKANEIELKLILHFFSLADGEFSEKEAAKLLKAGEAEISSALSFWRGAGILGFDGKDNKGAQAGRAGNPPAEAPKYTTLDLAQAMEREEFADLADFAQRKLGRLFNQTETAQLYGLYDYMCLPKDMIAGVIEYCASIDKTSMRYIEKTAVGMYDDGIRTLRELEYYLNQKKQAESAENRIKQIIGAENRALTKSERLHITKWMEQWRISDELIGLAYERTINSIAKPSVSYMSKILEGWMESGVKTAADAEGLKTRGAANQSGGIDLEDFIEKPVGR